MSLMLDEIHQQPDIIGKLVEAEHANVSELVAEIKRRDVGFVTIAARGTSDHAAIYGKYVLEIHNALPVALADPSVFTLYSAKIKLDRALVIGISQSGRAPDVIEYLTQSRESGALTLAITNEPGSPITDAAHFTVLCHAGKEMGVAATKTYTSTLSALYLLSALLGGDGGRVERLIACADSMRAALSVEEYISKRAERYRYMESGAVLARGYNFCTALETALKLAETSYIGMRGYSAADFMHGPIASIHEGDPCILIAPPGKTLGMMAEVAVSLKGRKADTLVISSDESLLSAANVPIKLDVNVEEDLSPLVYVIPGQLFAYYLALARGFDPDRPRGLSKITLTR